MLTIMKKTSIMLLTACLAFLSCSKKEGAAPGGKTTLGSVPSGATSGQSFVYWDPADATTAYNAFNTACYNPTAKLYYSTTQKTGLAAIWTQAIFWDMAMDVYTRTKATADMTRITDMYTGGSNQYNAYNWNNTTVWFIYDDMMWWINALARANKITGNAAYLTNATTGFDHVWAGSYDTVNGGMFWDFNHTGKNSCINFPTVIAAMRLYNITGNSAYLTKAQSIYTWAKANLTNTTTGQVYDNKIGSNPPGGTDYTYNSGTAIGAAYALYKQSGNSAYLSDATRYADYVKNNMCNAQGILPAEGDFNEQGTMKAIFADYIMQLINDGKQTQYLSWILTNVDTGWANRDPARNLTYRNYAVACPTGYIQTYEACSLVSFMQQYQGVVFFQNTLYGGTSSGIIPKGNYTISQLQTMGFVNDWASSATVPPGWTVTMYQDDNYLGQSWVITSDTPHFPNLTPTANDLVTSVKIQ
jgi:predicted alpha-1,6-mannanase (GH76 family)